MNSTEPSVEKKETLAERPAKKSGAEEQFFRSFRFSLGAHALVVIIGLLMTFVFKSEPVQFSPSLRVDIVDLPELTKNELSKVSPDDISDLSKKLKDPSTRTKKEAEPEPAKPDDTLVLKKKEPLKNRKQNLQNAIDRIKALSDIESEEKKKSVKNSVQAKGNALSKGDSLVGENTGDTNMFLSRLQTKLRDNWNLPVWLSKQELNAKVVVFLDRSGYVKHTVFAQPSGNAQFDDYVLKTIRMAQPFGDPPAEVLDGGVTLGFPL